MMGGDTRPVCKQMCRLERERERGDRKRYPTTGASELTSGTSQISKQINKCFQILPKLYNTGNKNIHVHAQCVCHATMSECIQFTKSGAVTAVKISCMQATANQLNIN